MVLFHNILIAVDKGISHALCMVFGSAEHDSLLHSVSSFQIFRNLSGKLINAVLEDDSVIVILVFVNAIFNENAIFLLNLDNVEGRNLHPSLLQYTFFDLPLCGVILEPIHIHILQRELHTNLFGVDFSLGKQDNRLNMHRMWKHIKALY